MAHAIAETGHSGSHRPLRAGDHCGCVQLQVVARPSASRLRNKAPGATDKLGLLLPLAAERYSHARHFPDGTRRFSSSNQSCTTWSCTLEACSTAPRIIRNLPFGATSYPGAG